MGGGGGSGAGGGGGAPSWPEGKSTNQLLADAVEGDQRSEYEQKVNSYLMDLLGDFNNRDRDQIATHLDTIQSALGKDVDGIRLEYAGSVSKHTYVDGLSDFDMLAILNKSELNGKSPEEVRQYFADMLRQRLPGSEVIVGKLAVTVRFSTSGHEFQILPAAKMSTGVRISKVDGTDWSDVIRPDVFAHRLTKVNREKEFKVVPVIKLFKAMNAEMPKEAQLSGYHAESLAVSAFSNYTGRKTHKDMLTHLCNFAADAVLTPIVDETGQSEYVDSYLGASGSLERQKVSAALNRASSRIRADDSAAAAEDWKGLFGE